MKRKERSWAIGVFELAVCLAVYFSGNALLSAIRRHTNNEKPSRPMNQLGFSMNNMTLNELNQLVYY